MELIQFVRRINAMILIPSLDSLLIQWEEYAVHKDSLAEELEINVLKIMVRIVQ